MQSHNTLVSPACSKLQLSIKRSSLKLIFLSALLLQTACVSSVSSQVKEVDKDVSGSFNGRWIAQVQRSPGQHYMPGNWVVNCNGNPREFNLNVVDSVAIVGNGSKNEKTYVGANGDFRFQIPTNVEAKASVGSERELALTKTSVIIYGNFVKAKGRYTYAYEEFGNAGCTATIKFVRKQ